MPREKLNFRFGLPAIEQTYLLSGLTLLIFLSDPTQSGFKKWLIRKGKFVLIWVILKDFREKEKVSLEDGHGGGDKNSRGSDVFGNPRFFLNFRRNDIDDFF